MKNIFTLGAAHPAIDESAFIAPTAVLIGDVSVGARSSVWFNCVLQGDRDRHVPDLDGHHGDAPYGGFGADDIAQMLVGGFAV